MDTVLKVLFAIVPLAGLTASQESTTNSLGDFVKGLTKLISDNGGLGSLVNALPRPDGSYQGPPYPGYAPGYPQGSYDEELRPYRPLYRPPPSRYPPPHYPPPGGHYPPPGGHYPPPGGHYPPPALPPGLYPPPGYGYPPQQGLLHALSSIARHDDLRCVPRLLCEVTSGGKPGYPSYTQAQQTTRDAITSLLTVLNFMDDNPVFIFGRAALLGAASRGNSAACLNAYPTCPRDPDRLVHYLNNHNGGFFRFFGGLPGYQQRLKGEGPEPAGEADENLVPEDGESRIQNRPSYQAEPAVRYPTRRPHGLVFEQSHQSASHLRPAEPQDYLPVSAHGGDYSGGGFVFPTEDGHRTRGHRGGKLLAFPQESGPAFDRYKPDFSPPQNLINFREQRAVKFPSQMNFPKS